MEQQSTYTIRVPTTLKKAFDEAVKANDRSGSQEIREFMRQYIKKHAQGNLKGI